VTTKPDRSVEEIVAEAQAFARQILRGKNVSSDDFLAERRLEAAKEEAEFQAWRDLNAPSSGTDTPS
jgi:hypothetical protein